MTPALASEWAYAVFLWAVSIGAVSLVIRMLIEFYKDIFK